ncbi:nuclear transport factor 2 family protein [Mycobacterium sp.]|uniref:nuclear transport factor 2 family protein n=1 Tax=Mycobacterium sp. TaxID=1785 RepID=UPI003F960103
MSVDDRLARLEQRLREVEDELAILKLMASYGPLADAGEADAAAALWARDGEYDVEGWRMRSRESIADMLRSGPHWELLRGGCAHFFGPAHVRVDGDEAVAVCESILIRRRNGAYGIHLSGVHHVRLRRFTEGWRITHRTTRLLDGSAEARDLLRAVIQLPSA